MILTKYILKTIMGGEWEDPVLEKLVKTEKRYEIATFIMEQEGYQPNKVIEQLWKETQVFKYSLQFCKVYLEKSGTQSDFQTFLEGNVSNFEKLKLMHSLKNKFAPD